MTKKTAARFVVIGKSKKGDKEEHVNDGGGKKLSGAQKRKKRREKEEALKEAVADMERLKLGPTKLWTGLVLHHKDVFVSHVLSKLNGTDRFFFSEVNRESRGVLEYAGVDVSELHWCIDECSSISTLELAWNHMPWGEKDERWRRDEIKPGFAGKLLQRTNSSCSSGREK